MKRQRGFTLVELMVSLVLFSLLIAGVLSVAVTMAQGYREQRQVVATDTSVRAPMDYLGDLIRQAAPGVPTGQVYVTAGPAACPSVGSPTSISTTNFNNKSDVLDIVFAYGGFVTSTKTGYGPATTSLTLTDATNLKANDTLLIATTDRGHLLFVTNVTGNVVTLQASAGCISPTLPPGGYPVNSLVLKVMKASITTGPDPQDNTLSNLWLNPYFPPTGYPAGLGQPIAENIEDMQISLGHDANGDSIITPNEFEFSAATPGAVPGFVRAVRMTLTSRAPQALIGGTGFFTPAAEDRPAGATDGFRRRTLTTTVEVRNMKGSP